MRRLLALLAALPLAGCDSPTLPPRATSEIYDFRLDTSPPQVLRWPSGTRVDVYVAADAAAREQLLASALARGAAEWNRHALYGEYEVARTASLSNADVVLRWSDETAPIDMSGCPPGGAIAVTTFCLDDTGLHLEPYPVIGAGDEEPNTVRFVITILGTQAAQPDVAERLVLHELGHVLGIVRHSTNANDLMATGVPTRSTLSLRDIATVRILYHTEPHITP